MYRFLSTCFFLLMINPIIAQSITEMPLYSGAIPGSKKSSVKEKVIFENGIFLVSDVIAPTLTKFSPAKPNGMAVIICPGGGYGVLALDHEGVEVARLFNESGITAFVLKSRLPNDIIMLIKASGHYRMRSKR